MEENNHNPRACVHSCAESLETNPPNPKQTGKLPIWPCLLLIYCACDGVVSCQSTAPATGLSFWNIGPAALRDTPRSPAAMLRQCKMDWSCLMLLYSVPQQHCRRGCGGSALPAQNLSGEKMQDHMEVRPWRPHGMFFISQERRNTSRDENLHVLWR